MKQPIAPQEQGGEQEIAEAQTTESSSEKPITDIEKKKV